MSKASRLNPDIPQPARLLRFPEVKARTGLPRSTLYLLMRQGNFPKQKRLSERVVAWREDEVQRWIEQRGE
jgi:prophage regulatory protein